MSIQIGGISRGRPRSLSDALSLEDDVKGTVIVKDIKGIDPDENIIGVKQGDALAGATIYFGNLNKDDILSIIKCTESHNAEVKLHSKDELSSPNLKIGWPDFNLRSQDSSSGTAAYEKIFNSKIRPRLRSAKSTEDLLETNTLSHRIKAKFGSNDNILDSDFTGTTVKGKYNISSPNTDINLKSPYFRSEGDVFTPNPHGDMKEMAIAGPQFDSTSDVKIDKPKGTLKFPEIKGQNIKLPSFNVSAGQNVSSDVDLNLKTPNMKSDLDISMPRVQGEVKGPNIKGAQIGLNTPDVNFEKTEGKLDLSGYKIPTIKGLELKPKGPDLDVKGKLSAPALDISVPKVQGGIKGPDVDDIDVKLPQANIKGPSIKMPSSNMSEDGKISGPDVDLNLKAPHLKGGVDISAPKLQGDIKGPNVKGPQLDLNTPNIDVDKPEGKFKWPFKMPTVKGSEPKVKVPDLDAKMKAPNINIPTPKIGGGITGPDASAKLPQANIKGLDIKMPSVNLSGNPNISAPDVDMNLKAPNLKGGADISVPHLQGDIKGPHLDINAPDINLEKAGGKFKLPAFKMPTIKGDEPKLTSPDLTLNAKAKAPNIDVSVPEVEGGIKGPDIHGKLPQTSIKVPNIKMPSINLSGDHNISGPDVDLNLKAPDFKGGVDISPPKLQGDIKGPNVKGPQLDLNTPNTDVDKPEGKFKWPFKMPTVKGSEPIVKVPDLDVKMKAPNINIPTPKIDGGITSPDVSAKLPQANIKGMDIKMPSVSVSGDPNISAPDVDMNLKAPNLKGGADISLPHLQGDIKGPHLDTNIEKAGGKFSLPGIKMPTIKGDEPKLKSSDLNWNAKAKTPNIDISVPEVEGGIKGPDINGKLPQTSIKGPDIKMPSINISGDHNIPGPDVDLNLKAPNLKGGVNISPNLQGDFKGTDIKGPHFGINAPDIDLEKSVEKFNLPGIKLPTFKSSEPKLKGPEVDLSSKAKIPRTDISTPKIGGGIEGPGINIMDPGVKMPSFNMSGNKVSVPDVDVNIKSPTLKGGIDIPSPKLQLDSKGPNIKGPAVDVNVSHANIDSPTGKAKTPWFKMPSFGGKAKVPSANVDVATPSVKGNVKANVDLNAPNVDLDVPEVKSKSKFKMPSLFSKSSTPDISLKVPSPKVDNSLSAPKMKVDIKSPNNAVSEPGIDIDAPNVDITGTEAKAKIGRFRLPSFGGPDINTDTNLKLPTADITLPASDTKGLKMKMPSVPASGLEMPESKLDLGLKSTKPKGGIDISGPSLNVQGPAFDVKSPKLDSGISEGNIKLPAFKTNLRTPENEIKGDMAISSPGLQADLNGPELEINAPDMNLKGLKGNKKFPDVSMPFFGKLSSNFKGDGDINVSGPKLSGNLETPDVDINLPDSDISGPKFKMPSVNTSGPNSSLPSADINLNAPNVKGDLDLSSPKIDTSGANVGSKIGKFSIPKIPNIDFTQPKGKGPGIDLDAHMNMPSLDSPNIDINLPKADMKSPQLNISTPNINTSNVDLNLKSSGHKCDANLSAPEIKGSKMDSSRSDVSIGLPNMSMESPDMKMKFPQVKLPSSDWSGPKVKRPDVNLDGTIKSPHVDMSLPSVKGDLQMPEINMGSHMPDVDLDVPDANVNSSSKFRFPTFSAPNISMPNFDFGMKSPKIKNDTDLPTLDIKGGYKSPYLDNEHPEGDVNVPEINTKVPVMNLKASKFKGPSFGVSEPTMPSTDIDGNIKAPDMNLPRSKIEGSVNTPDVNVKLPDSDSKGPKFKMPTFDFFGLKSSKPDINLKSPDQKLNMGISSPQTGGGIKGPNIQIKSPNAHVSAPDLDVRDPLTGSKVKITSYDFSGPVLTGPEVGVDVPNVSIKGDLKATDIPDVQLQGSGIKGKEPKMKSEIGVTGPNVQGKFPNFGLGSKMPKGEAGTSDLNINSSESPKSTKKGKGTFKVSKSASVSDLDNLPETESHASQKYSSSFDIADGEDNKSLFKFPKFSALGSKNESTTGSGDTESKSLSAGFHLPKIELSI